MKNRPQEKRDFNAFLATPITEELLEAEGMVSKSSSRGEQYKFPDDQSLFVYRSDDGHGFMVEVITAKGYAAKLNGVTTMAQLSSLCELATGRPLNYWKEGIEKFGDLLDQIPHVA